MKVKRKVELKGKGRLDSEKISNLRDSS